VISFLADENLKRKIISGLLRRDPFVDVIRAQDAGLSGVEDRVLLEWATQHGRVLLTHDVQTLVLVRAECSEPEEWAGVVAYLPV
jgi:predicted nuclease of predicted toxin-antitoxin system